MLDVSKLVVRKHLSITEVSQPTQPTDSTSLSTTQPENPEMNANTVTIIGQLNATPVAPNVYYGMSEFNTSQYIFQDSFLKGYSMGRAPNLSTLQTAFKLYMDTYPTTSQSEIVAACNLACQLGMTTIGSVAYSQVFASGMASHGSELSLVHVLVETAKNERIVGILNKLTGPNDSYPFEEDGQLGAFYRSLNLAVRTQEVIATLKTMERIYKGGKTEGSAQEEPFNLHLGFATAYVHQDAPSVHVHTNAKAGRKALATSLNRNIAAITDTIVVAGELFDELTDTGSTISYQASYVMEAMSHLRAELARLTLVASTGYGPAVLFLPIITGNTEKEAFGEFHVIFDLADDFSDELDAVATDASGNLVLSKEELLALISRTADTSEKTKHRKAVRNAALSTSGGVTVLTSAGGFLGQIPPDAFVYQNAPCWGSMGSGMVASRQMQHAHLQGQFAGATAYINAAANNYRTAPQGGMGIGLPAYEGALSSAAIASIAGTDDSQV